MDRKVNKPDRERYRLRGLQRAQQNRADKVPFSNDIRLLSVYEPRAASGPGSLVGSDHPLLWAVGDTVPQRSTPEPVGPGVQTQKKSSIARAVRAGVGNPRPAGRRGGQGWSPGLQPAQSRPAAACRRHERQSNSSESWPGLHDCILCVGCRVTAAM